MATSIDQQFVEYIVKTLVNHPDKVEITRTVDERGVLLSLEVDPEDVGRVIGRRGATAQSIRTLLRALGTKNEARYNLKIVNSDDYEPTNRSDDSQSAGATSADDSFAPEDHDNDSVSSDDTEETPTTDHVETSSDEPVEKSNKLAEKTRADLAELDDLDI